MRPTVGGGGGAPQGVNTHSHSPLQKDAIQPPFLYIDTPSVSQGISTLLRATIFTPSPPRSKLGG